MDLSVRPLAADDFDGFINYWLGLSQAEIERLGVAIDRVPSAARMRSDLEAMLIAPDDEVRSFVLAWCINGEAIRPFITQRHRAGRLWQHSFAHVARGFAWQRARPASFLSGSSRFLRTIQAEAHHL